MTRWWRRESLIISLLRELLQGHLSQDDVGSSDDGIEVARYQVAGDLLQVTKHAFKPLTQLDSQKDRKTVTVAKPFKQGFFTKHFCQSSCTLVLPDLKQRFYLYSC